MKKKRQKPTPKKGKGGPVPQPKARSRRDVLRLAQTAGIGALVLGGIGYYSVTSVMATHAELDLSRVGQGTPTVVQIHDPQCRQCQMLQAEAREAMSAFDEADLTYLVANIRTASGRRLASQHGVGHVTLLLFDGRGELRDTIHGVTDSAILEAQFVRHMNVSKRRLN
ncbi:MAG: hypothetical protein AAF501_21740 [Pseudomonadota bacterium]